MKTLKLFLIGIFSVLLTMSIIASASAIEDSKTQKLLYISLNYKDNRLTANELAWGKGFLSAAEINPIINLEKASLKILDKDRNVLYSSEFYVMNKIMADIINEETGEISGSTVELNDVNFTEITPYFNNMDRIEISSSYNDIILQKDKLKNIKEMRIATAEGDNGNDNTSADSDNESKKKSFILELVNIIGSIYNYIFR